MANVRARGSNTLDVAVSGRYKDLMEGKIDVADLSPEELARGQLKDKNGRFTGRPPKFLPRDLVMRMRREFLARGDKAFEDSYLDAVNEMKRIMTSAKVDDAVRLKAAIYIVERVGGKTPEHIEMKVDAPWMGMLQRMIVPVAALEESAADGIEDAEVVESDEPGPVHKRKRA